jgi:hypothetical protein
MVAGDGEEVAAVLLEPSGELEVLQELVSSMVLCPLLFPEVLEDISTCNTSVRGCI